ncbi:MAG: hypothetical protein FWD97_00780 [Defluviitaleaceae bacterium]|nr:hypothetical protein [Defluviitaleaceae bacterium]
MDGQCLPTPKTNPSIDSCVEGFGMVGAGIARPSSTGNAVQPLRLVPAEMGRAMPAPTSMLLF